MRIVLGELLAGQEPVRSRQTTVLMAVVAVSVLVLLMACGNVGNLLILSGLRRSQELALKAALGATRGRLLREVFVQAILLALLAGAGALSMVLTVGGLVRRVLLPPLAATAAPIDARLMLLTVGICGAAALALGLVPAIRLSATRVKRPVLATEARRHRGSSTRSSDCRWHCRCRSSSAPASSRSACGKRSMSTSASRPTTRPSSAPTSPTTAVEEAHAAHRRIQAHLQTLPGVTAVAMVQGAPSVGGYATPAWPESGPRNHEGAPMVNAVDPSVFRSAGATLYGGTRVQ